MQDKQLLADAVGRQRPLSAFFQLRQAKVRIERR